MSKWDRGLFVALENEIETTPAVVGCCDSAESEMLNFNQHTEELGRMRSSIKEAVDGARQLEDIAGVLGDQPATEAAAKIARLSVESIYKRLGVSNIQAPSLESFKQSVALEELLKTAKAIWDKIIKSVSVAWTWVKDFFNSLFTTNGKLKKRAEKYIKDIESMEKKADDKTLSTIETIEGNLSRELTMDGLFTAVTVEKGLEDYANIITTSNQTLISMIGIMQMVNINQKLDVKDIETKLDHSFKLMPVNKQFLGTRMFVLSPGAKNVPYIEKVDFNTQPYKELETIEVADSQQLIRICKNCIVFQDVIENTKGLYNKVENYYSDIDDKIKKMSKEKVDNPDAEKMLQIFVEMNLVISSALDLVNSTAVNIEKAALDYVEKCVMVLVAAR